MAALQELSEAELVAAIEANTQAAFLRWATALGAEVQNETHTTWFTSGLPFALCNGVIRAAFPSTEADSSIAAVLDQLRASNTPMCWLVGPSSQPDDLGRRLEAHGLAHAEDGVGMAVDLDALRSVDLPQGLTTIAVDDGATLRRWIDALCSGSDFPTSVRDHLHRDVVERHGLATAHGLSRHNSIRLYLGLLEGEPVATSLLFLDAVVAGLYDVATVPGARRRGIGAAISHAALRTARDAGYRLGVLQSSAMGESVYRRLGFRRYCTFGLYFWSPDQKRANPSGH